MSGISYRPLIDDMIWSYSRLSCYHNCPYEWFLKYIEDIKESPNFYASYGSFIHKLLEQYYNGKIQASELQTTFLLNFNKEVLREGVSPKLIADYREQGSAYFENFKPVPYEVVGVEKRVVADICGKRLFGFVDLVAIDGDGLVVIDHKSKNLKQPKKANLNSAMQQSIDDTMRQLYIYAEAIRQECGSYPKKICLNCFRNGNFIEENFDERKLEGALNWVTGTIHTIESDENFYPALDWFYCKNLCGYRDRCEYYESVYGGG